MRHIRRIIAFGAVLVAGALALPALASANASTCWFDQTTHEVSIMDKAPAGRLVLSQSNGYIQLQEPDASGPGTPSMCVSASGFHATVNDTDKITVLADSPSQFQETVIDETGGAFAPGYSKETDLSEIEFDIRTGSGDQLTVLDGGSGTSTVRVRSTATKNGAVCDWAGHCVALITPGWPQLDLNGDGDYDVDMPIPDSTLFSRSWPAVVKVVGGEKFDYIDGTQMNSYSKLELHGGSGGDVLKGGSGPDTLYGDYGDDSLYGNAGADTLNASDGAHDSAVDGGADTDQARGDGALDQYTSIEKFF